MFAPAANWGIATTLIDKTHMFCTTFVIKSQQAPRTHRDPRMSSKWCPQVTSRSLFGVSRWGHIYIYIYGSVYFVFEVQSEPDKVEKSRWKNENVWLSHIKYGFFNFWLDFIRFTSDPMVSCSGEGLRFLSGAMTGVVENGAKRFWNGYRGEKSTILKVDK